MMSLKECLKDDTRVFLISEEEEQRRKFSFFKKEPERRIFRKDFNQAEIIGEGICGIRNLRCAHFFVIGEGIYNLRKSVHYSDLRNGYHLRLGSYDFREPSQYDYFKICDFGQRSTHNFLEEVLELAPTEENRKQLLDEIEELFALDTYMGQTDRYWSNILFERNKKTKEIHLAPLYDFEYSMKKCYIDPKMIYDNLLHSFETVDDYIAFMSDHPEFREKLESYLHIDLIELIQRSYRSKGLQVPKDRLPFYEDFDQERKELIKSILK